MFWANYITNCLDWRLTLDPNTQPQLWDLPIPFFTCVFVLALKEIYSFIKILNLIL